MRHPLYLLFMTIFSKLSFLVILAVTISCNKKEAQPEALELEPLAYTLYTQNSELFVEFKPLVVGQPSKFAAHFTVLGDTFTALTDAKITVSLISDGKGIRNTVTAPSSPGIFRLALQPTTSGTGKLVFDIVTKTYSDKIVIDNITIYPDMKTAMSQQPPHSESGDISYLKEQAWKVEFANQSVTKQPFKNVIKTSGQLLSAPGDEVIVTAKAGGVVKFSASALVGSKVNAGNSLFIITGGDMTQGNIDAIVTEARANYLKSKSDYERSKSLAADQIISQREFQQVKLQYDNARTAYNTVANNYSSKGLNVVSPMSGFVKNILVAEGQFVVAGAPLATVSKNMNLILQANVSQSDFGKLSSITAANFKPGNDDKVYSTEELNGKILSYGKSAAANMPFIPVTIQIDNNGKLISGTAVEVYLKSSAITDALIVPISALVEEQGNYYVYVQTGGESFQKREVKLGASDGKQVQIISGIAENERVVTKGAYQIKLSSASGALPAHGHEH